MQVSLLLHLEEMSSPPDPDTPQKDPVVSTPALALPQLEEAEKGYQTRSKIITDSNQDTESQFPVEKEATEDEEWLENLAHPRNWPPRKKWSNMAIVSDFCAPEARGLKAGALRPGTSSLEARFPHHLTFVILGFVLHVSTSAHKLDDGAGSTTDR